jgi:hypothetical protein
MSISRHPIPSALVALAAVMVLLGTLCFSSLRPGYSQISNTISELGETGAAHAHLVAFGLFLPVGLAVWLALWLLPRETPGRGVSRILFALSCLGTGYVVSAFFPCDSGAPLLGSWRTLAHNIAGLAEYGGTAIGFLLASRRFARQGATPKATAFGAGGALGLVCLAILCLPLAFPIRGAVQRVAELIQFTGVFCVCFFLSRRGTPNERPALDAGTGVSLQSGHRRPPYRVSRPFGSNAASVTWSCSSAEAAAGPAAEQRAVNALAQLL